MSNIITDTDSYKASHWVQYPPGTSYVSSYFESRGGDFQNTLFFGLQYYLRRYLSKPITMEDILEAEELYAAHGEPFNKEGWLHILNEHRGYLPVEIEAVPEGLLVPTRNVLMQVRNTDPRAYWLTNYIETMLVRTWYPTTVATQSYEIRKLIQRFLDITSMNTDPVYRLHDFGSRGVSSRESSGIGGLAHLVNFMGTDTVEALLYGRRYYDEPMAGHSIPASEHSTITSWGRDNEDAAFENMIDQYGGPGKMVACVSDNYNILQAIEKWYKLRDKIAQSGTTLVIRPDSPTAPGESVDLTVLTVMSKVLDTFGYELNDKGFATLPPYIRVIQGDGVDLNSIQLTLHRLKKHGIATENLSFGMGGALLQKLDRDTQKFAFKCSAIKLGANPWQDVYKEPMAGGKTSKRGILQLVHENGGFQTIRADSRLEAGQRLRHDQKYLKTVYVNGRMPNSYTLADVRQRAWG